MYRKPEWVTRMEVARAQMEGKECTTSRMRMNDSETSMSSESLTMHEFLAKYHSVGDISTGSDSVFISECSSRRTSFKANDYDTLHAQFMNTELNGVSSASIFAQSVLSGYLQSHRQSISAAIDAIHNQMDDSPDKTPVPSDDEFTLSDEEHCNTPDTPVNDEITVPASEIIPLEAPRHFNFATILSPIQENGETPTSDSVSIEQTTKRMQQENSKNDSPDLLSASSMEELKEFLLLETMYTSY